MPLLIQKFGGTSVADADKILVAASKATRAHRSGSQVVVVVSARGDTTDELVATARQLSSHPPAREMDMLLSTGEQVSVALMAIAIQARGVPAISFTGSQIGIVTDSFHTKARIRNISTERMAEALDDGKIVIVAGFQGVAATPKRTSRCTTDSNHGRPVAEDVVDRQFEPEAANRTWTADITDVATGEGWLYLAAVEDLDSRRIVGGSMGERVDSRLVVDALEMALAARRPGAGLVAHSDRGSQYASEHYQRLLAGRGITCRMSRRGNGWDNAPMESFFVSLKKELTRSESFATRAEARASLFDYIEVFYNRIRRHSSLGYMSPVEYERAG